MLLTGAAPRLLLRGPARVVLRARDRRILDDLARPDESLDRRPGRPEPLHLEHRLDPARADAWARPAVHELPQVPRRSQPDVEHDRPARGTRADTRHAAAGRSVLL